ncbi:glycosyl transferase family 2 [Thermomonas sp.]
MTQDLAIVVPAGPGDIAWQGLLPQLVPAAAREILLVLPDDTTDAPNNLPANVRTVRASAGRASQLNAGANTGVARWLWFLHADSRVDATTLAAVAAFVAEDADAIGYFDLGFLDDGPWLTALNAAGANLRSRIAGLPFGDQGLLMPRRVFDALGGFDLSLPSGEDHALVWKARHAGIPLRRLAAPIYTSARKYAQHGWWRTTRHHLLLTCRQAWRHSREHP